MFELFRRHGAGKTARQQAQELEALIAASREERAALAAMLAELQAQSAKLAAAAKALQDAEERAGQMQKRLEETADRPVVVDETSTMIEGIEARIKKLVDVAVAHAAQNAAKLTALDGEFRGHQLATRDLSSQMLEIRASLRVLEQAQSSMAGRHETVKEPEALTGKGESLAPAAADVVLQSDGAAEAGVALAETPAPVEAVRPAEAPAAPAESVPAPALRLANLGMSRDELADFVRRGQERRAAAHDEVEAFAARVQALHASIAGAAVAPDRPAAR